jgi:hypothetical protein
LYGKALEPHLKEEVIQKTLLKELKSAPDLFVLPPADMAGGWSGDAKCPAVALQKTQEAPLAKAGETFRVSPREVLLQCGDGGSPLRVIFASAVEPAAQEQALQKLLEAAYQMDPLEPLERVHAALQTLVKQE